MPEYNWITDEIFTVSDFFTAAECDAYIQLAESIGFTDAPINTTFGQQIRRDVRNNTRVMLDDADRASELWNRAEVFVPKFLGRWCAIGVNERFRFYRYDVGQQFETGEAVGSLVLRDREQLERLRRRLEADIGGIHRARFRQ